MSEELSSRNDAEVIRELSKLMFSAADKTFKFVSWGIIITVVQYAYHVTHSPPLYWLVAILLAVYGLTIVSTAVALPVTDLTTLRLPRAAKIILRLVLVVVGIGGFSLMLAGGANNIVDQMMADLSKATHPVAP